MNADTGNIHNFTAGQSQQLSEDFQKRLESSFEEAQELASEANIPIAAEDLSKVKRMSKPRRKNWMRNKPCPCGSEKKFKKCCWNKFSGS